MAAADVSEQDALAHLSQSQPDTIPASTNVQANGIVTPSLQDSANLAASAAEESMPTIGQHEASAEPADEQIMEDIPEPPSADEAPADSPTQTSQGLQLPPQQLHSRLSQVPAYAQLPQVSGIPGLTWFLRGMYEARSTVS